MAIKKRGGSGVDWFCPSVYMSVAGTLAVDAQEVVADVTFDDASAQVYDQGALVGFRMWYRGYAGAQLQTPPEVIVMILPVGVTVPTVNTEALRLQEQSRIWAQGLAHFAPIDVAGGKLVELDLELRSVRRFERGGRLVVVLINRDRALAWANPHSHALAVDSYVRED